MKSLLIASDDDKKQLKKYRNIEQTVYISKEHKMENVKFDKHMLHNWYYDDTRYKKEGNTRS